MKLVSLNKLKKGEIGIISKIESSGIQNQEKIIVGEVEARLLEMGFIEGAKLQVLHIGMFGCGPIAVRINNNSSVMALRTTEAKSILVQRII